LSSTTLGTTNPLTEPYLHDEHGNMIRMPHLANHASAKASNMHWDYKDQLSQADMNGAGTAYYVYDAGGQRTRKVWEKAPGLVEERIYLGGFEIFRRGNGGGVLALERETLHVMDDKQRIAMVETRTLPIAPDPADPVQLIRYQFGNHLGSSILELDEQAQIISYEEYTPYGSTSYQAVRSQTENAKRYRYTGKERDAESGFYYHGARYYAPWLGRWCSCDPAGFVDGPDLYAFVRDNPVCLRDSSGLAGGWEDISDALRPEADKIEESGWAMGKKASGTSLDPLPQAEPRMQQTPLKNPRGTYSRGAAGAREGATGLGVPEVGDEMGHMSAARDAKTAIPRDIANAPENIEAIPARDKTATVYHQDGRVVTTDPHAAQEHLINEAQARAQKGKVPGTLESSIAAQDAMQEVKIKSEPLTRRHINEVKAVATEGKEALSLTAKTGANEGVNAAEKTGLKEGAKLLGTKAAKFVPFVGIGVGIGLVAKDLHDSDYASAAWDAAEAIPVLGDVVGAGHFGIVAGGAANEGLGIEKVAAEHGMIVEGAAKSLGLSTDTSRMIGAAGAALSSITVAPNIAFQRMVAGWFR